MSKYTLFLDDNNLVRGFQAGHNAAAGQIYDGPAPRVNEQVYVSGELQDAPQDLLDATFLPSEKNAKMVALQMELREMVDYQPNGLERYPSTWRDAAKDLRDLGGFTAGQEALYQGVKGWMNDLYGVVYYPTRAAIDAAASLDELSAITWDTDPFEIGSGTDYEDPNVSLADLQPGG